LQVFTFLLNRAYHGNLHPKLESARIEKFKK
jgi:hypothetical protein